jgi:serine/threonine-protein kinase
MAAVYQVADTHIRGKIWAVKEMSAAAITNPTEKLQALEAFRREAELLSRLSHPNVPRVVDFFGEGGKQYLVMEFIEGRTLEEKLSQLGRPLSETEVRPWAEQLCDVLDHLHGHHPPIIFRDLKPGNVMIDRAGNVKLIDFGIVRFFQPGKARDTVSFGTAGYAPPEQYGKGQTDARSDIYSLGATLHHLLTGHDPALTPFQFQPLRKLNPGVSAAMETAVMCALEHDPARRWPSASKMRQAMNKTPPAPPRPIPSPPVGRTSYVRPKSAVSPSLKTGAFAGFGRRLLAFSIDGILLSTVYTVFAMCPIVAVPNPTTEDEEILLGLLVCGTLLVFMLVVGWYYVLLPAGSGQTLGKKIMGIKMIAIDGSPPGKGRCFLRLIGYVLSSLILYVGFLMALWDQERQALHDKLAGTYVVRA